MQILNRTKSNFSIVASVVDMLNFWAITQIGQQIWYLVAQMIQIFYIEKILNVRFLMY